MSSAESLESLAKQNLIKAKEDQQRANKFKASAKADIEQAKGREAIVKKELDLWKARVSMAQKIKDIVIHKQKLMDVLHYSELGLKMEENRAAYNLKMAQIIKPLI